MATGDNVRRIAMSLPETEPDEDPMRFAVRGKAFTWTFTEPVKGQRGRNQAGSARCQPRKVLHPPASQRYPAVLVRLAAVGTEELAELVTDGWRCQAPTRLVRQFESR